MSATGLSLTLSASTTLALVSTATRINATPLTLADAIIATVLRGGLLEAILEGVDPAALAGGYNRLPNGLTYRQAAVLYLLGEHADEDGLCRMPQYRIAEIADIGRNTMQAAVGILRARKLVEAVSARTAGGIRLTAAGRKEAAALGSVMVARVTQ